MQRRTDTQFVRRPQRPKNRPKLDRLTIGLLIAFGVVAVATAIVAFIVIRNLVAGWTVTPLPGAPVDNNKTGQESGPIATIPPDTVLQGSEGPKAKPWDGKSRVNVLVMGLDYRDWETGGEASRTDTMILFTLDPVGKTAGMLSIPRDLWVAIPDFDYGKINTAYFLGESYKMPGGGPGLAVKTVEQFLGVPINFYAQIDFAAFTRFIDLIDGVKVTPTEDMKIAAVGKSYDVYLKAGETVTLNGELALAYARNRYTSGDDFDRSRRQQEVIMGIRDRILDFNMAPNLLAKAPKIYNELASGIHTNMTFDQAIQLALFLQAVPRANIHQAQIGTEEVTFGTSPDGLAILKPIPDKIRIVRDKIFAEGGVGVSQTKISSDKLELAKAEGARISVQNGAGEPGLASRTSEFLKGKGLNVVEETNGENTANTVIILYNATPYTLAYLSDLMGVPEERIQNRYGQSDTVDIAVILGTDWAQSNPMP